MFHNNRSIHSLTRLGVSLGASLVSLSVTFGSVLAAPAPIFDPVLDKIVAALPEGWGIRLPASVEAEVELYPYINPIMTSYGSIFLGLSTEPGCTEGDCVGAFIFVSLQTDDQPPSDQGTTVIDLGNGIQGYATPFPEGTQIRWMQDDLMYVLVHQFDVISEADGVAMAQSMVSEPPITAVD